LGLFLVSLRLMKRVRLCGSYSERRNGKTVVHS